jgi:xanthine dehydrogenase D subunit
VSTIDDTRTRGAGGRLGEPAPRPDAVPKVRGEFVFSSDLWADQMLWGQTLRSPHPHARIKSIDISAALTISGVHAVLTHADIPGPNLYGLEHPDTPVLAADVVRYVGEPVALVAADHPDIAKRAVAAISVDYVVVEPLVDPEIAIDAPSIHPNGNVVRHMSIEHGDPAAVADVVVEGTYEVGMQDQAFMGTESGLALPDEGGVELHVSTQWLHSDRRQIAAALGLDEDLVRLSLAGVGGAFGGREDVSLHIHLCLLALHTRRPVKMVYDRGESFLGHVHRHPARMTYRHHATSAGELVKVEARIVLDGGAYASTTAAVLANASCFSTGPYRVPNAVIEGWGVRTNNPPCGAMRGFGNVQTCFAVEAQMDLLAERLGIDPVELRLLNALETGDQLITGQVITGTAPVREVIRAAADQPMPASRYPDYLARPGGAGRTTDGVDVHRGVGFAVSIKNLMFSEGFDDYAEASCTIDNGIVVIQSACAEVGQGFVTLAGQIAREVLGVEHVQLAPIDTTVGSAGSTSASRQTWMSGGAVKLACEAARDTLLIQLAEESGVPTGSVSLADGWVRSKDSSVDMSIEEALAGRTISEHVTHRHAPTSPLDAKGQGDAHVSFAFAAHRAVVDVDLELGLVRVVEVATAQDVGRVLNPLQARGQIEGGIAQGVGLAVMEEIIVTGGVVANATFTDYLIPTALDMPPVEIAALIEQPEPGAPFGAKGIGEPPTISSTPAVVAAIRAATGLALDRVPVRPQDIALA